MQPWLEDLSEDWIAEPQPSSPPANAAADLRSSATHNADELSSQPRSRLPRFRNSSGSYSAVKTRPIQPKKQRGPLSERTSNEQNILPTSSPIPHKDNDMTRPRPASRSVSESSAGSVVYNGTVAQKPIEASSGKARIHDTPEWRKRLIKGDMGYGDQKDLFSPMGLENIFQQPAGPPQQVAKKAKSGLRFLNPADALPSSPPPWPSILDRNPVHTQPTRNSSHASNATENGQTETNVDQAFLEASRTASGQLELENESFSPVFISKHNTVDGRVDYAAVDLHKSDIVERLRKLAVHQEENSELSMNNTGLTENAEGSSYARLQEDTLPEDLPAGTPDVADLGEFVSTRRGGYSADGSFQRRPLTPTPGSQLLSDTDMEGSVRVRPSQNPEITLNDDEGNETDIRPRAPNPPHVVPITPRRQNAKMPSPDRTRSSGSPLKLFDTHDTFTSNRLQRRLSQLEENPIQHHTGVTQTLETGSPRRIQKESRLTSVEEVSIQKITTVQSRRETFGQGQLDTYQFPDEISYLSSGDGSFDHGTDPEDSPDASIAPPGSQPQFQFRTDSLPQLPSNSSFRRKPSRNSSTDHVPGLKRYISDTQKRHMHESAGYAGNSVKREEQIAFEHAEGKRPPTSPRKDPTPKRRRTLHAIDGEESVATEMESIKEKHVAMQSVIGRKRKDARQGGTQNVADPEILARRHILRPRNPTPSQRRREEIEAEIYEATEAFLMSSPKLQAIQEHLNSPGVSNLSPEAAQATAVAGEVAAFSMKVAQGMKDGARKRSVTTQDFLDEAMKIMEFIRTKGRPMSGLGSLEETETESPSNVEDETPSTPLTFSRPPSREGVVGGWRIPQRQREMDARVASHLQRFQEKDSDEFMASSIQSLKLGRSREFEHGPNENVAVQQNNIRITKNVNHGQSGYHSHESYGSMESGPRTHGSHPSNGSSFGRTVVTNTSRRSDHVATLAPEAVAHLIPEQVAGMSFDREKGIWVKSKSPVKEKKYFADISSTNESEDDPFGNIPDLTVDEVQEAPTKEPSSKQMPDGDTLDERPKPSPQDDVRPETREGKAIPPVDSSSVPSKFFNLAWSGPQVETRATSWSEQDADLRATEKIYVQPRLQQTRQIQGEDVEHEIQINEGRTTAHTSTNNPRLRDVTITFSSPYAPRLHSDAFKPGEAEHTIEFKSRTLNEPRSSTKPKSTFHSGTAPFFAGAVPPIDENGELSIVDDSIRRMKMSVSVSAPRLVRHGQHALIPAPPTPGGIADVTFMLSDLPDFTVNQVDERELPDRVIVRRDGSIRQLEDRYALGTAELVKALQDVEPDEPYWEDLHEVDLHDKGLTNLHRLDEFCCRVEDLDVSKNGISQLNGAPSTIRRLKIQDNALTSLTSWSYLMNLQYLDISQNDLDSLKGVSKLIHLRTLKADDNQIESLDGVLEMDGLIELSVRRNRVETVDFDFSNLKSLVDLDLSGNGLLEIQNVHCLLQLRHLNLDDNSLRAFPTSDLSSTPCRSLRSLRLCSNTLEVLEVSVAFPGLESLYVDKNGLTEIKGLESLKYLRTLSAREQYVDGLSASISNTQPLVRHSDIRNLYMSANAMPTFAMNQDFLNLQRLELASSGLQSLPSNFGQMAPNVRSLNLNFNALNDLRPLLNIKRLQELLVAGNRLSQLRKTLAVLSKLTTLTKIDLRDNPLTIGFYPPAVENRLVALKDGISQGEELEPFTLPASNRVSGDRFLKRLDEGTRLRRRVHEMMMATNCASLQDLDGLPFDSRDVLKKDEVWERLRDLGIIKKAKRCPDDFETTQETR
ncbi:uncharacterized protein BDZ99DRAFT_502290 [Mytilinidion resinicola]|uniref:L domain-like protein n=1 Tax=Mytilinidion resinicola TaxID=574789 RepID=A0A6A6Y7M1_9PEZI|nr:uncharacterized protein BDZ99DRAFT_502290 [Mytilinidion resinicola]KAF2804841.1 hypothetical protein BDZ99DRAFT_502290 [Mytilinidion resinicola]